LIHSELLSVQSGGSIIGVSSEHQTKSKDTRLRRHTDNVHKQMQRDTQWDRGTNSANADRADITECIGIRNGEWTEGEGPYLLESLPDGIWRGNGYIASD